MMSKLLRTGSSGLGRGEASPPRRWTACPAGTPAPATMVGAEVGVRCCCCGGGGGGGGGVSGVVVVVGGGGVAKVEAYQ